MPDLNEFENEYWYGFCHVDYEKGLADWVKTNPEKLLDERNIVVSYKNHRNQLAEINWPNSQNQNKRVVLKAFGTRTKTDKVRMVARRCRSLKHIRNAKLLLDKGIRTPELLFLALPKMSRIKAKLSTHYLAVEPVESVPLRDLLVQIQNGKSTLKLASTHIRTEELIIACGRFIREVHDQGIVHRDISGGNILIPLDWNGNMNNLKSTFCLVDINRLRYVGSEMAINLRIQDLEKLKLPEEYLKMYFDAYAGKSDEIKKEWPRFKKYRAAYRKMRETKNRAWRNVLMLTTYWTRSG